MEWKIKEDKKNLHDNAELMEIKWRKYNKSSRFPYEKPSYEFFDCLTLVLRGILGRELKTS